MSFHLLQVKQMVSMMLCRENGVDDYAKVNVLFLWQFKFSSNSAYQPHKSTQQISVKLSIAQTQNKPISRHKSTFHKKNTKKWKQN